MSPEQKFFGITIADFESDKIWRAITDTLIESPDTVQEVKFTDGPLMGEGFLMSMHREHDGRGYVQIDSVTSNALETIFMNYCMDEGEILPVGIYRFPFDTIERFSENH